MPPSKSKKINEGIAETMLRCHRARERGKRAYAQSDALLEELLAEIDPGQLVRLQTQKGLVAGSAKIVDKLADGKTKVADVGYFRRYELKVLP